MLPASSCDERGILAAYHANILAAALHSSASHHLRVGVHFVFLKIAVKVLLLAR